MLAGFGGQLVAEAFLEQQIQSGPFAQRPPAWRDIASRMGPASSLRLLLQAGAVPLLESMGFATAVDIVETETSVAATMESAAGTGRVALIVAPFRERLDRLWRTAVTEALRRRADWCVVFNGTHVRIVDATRVYARRFAEFDVTLAGVDAAAARALERLLSADALTSPMVEPKSLHALVAESDRHAAGVCQSLRDGVLSASADLVGAMAPHRRNRRQLLNTAFEQALTIVYRILFLLFAEARSLVPLWHPVYRESYSIESLREMAERPSGASGLWDALRAIARLAHAGCRAGDLRVTPFNGRLFAPAHTPLADRDDLDDEAARSAVLALSTRRSSSRAARERIAYRDLGVEQLGAVYETLLDYEPRADAERRVTLQTGSGVRKSTGTFYTPQPIAEYLVRRTLAPLVATATAERILALRILDPSMGSGAFLVAACRYLAAEYERALANEGPVDFDDGDRAAIRRTIAERCLYGVDVNPMAVQLARLSLWLATLAADRPLGFLDHRLRTGDSLLGAWVSDLRRPPRPLRRSRTTGLPLFGHDAPRDALRDAVPLRFSLELMPTDTLEQVRAKERAHDAVSARRDLAAWRRVADLWCATWFARRGDAGIPAEMFAALSDAVLTGRSALASAIVERSLAEVDAVAAQRRFFHWELEFPEAFFDASGARNAAPGFDAILGNPPWDMIRADTGPTARRADTRHETAQLVRFTRDAGVYAAQSDGHANRYQLFVERALRLTRPGGRLGLVLPSGFATDHGSARLRQRLFAECDVEAIAGVDNRRGVFPIHRSVRFLLVTGSRGRPTGATGCRFGIDDPSQLEHLGDEPALTSAWFPVCLSRDLLERVSGPGLAVPMVATAAELAVLERAATLFPPCGDSRGWHARFGRELNATEDRGVFRTAGGGLPVVEGKHLEPFRVTLAACTRSVSRSDAARLLRSRTYESPRLAYRDVASATNRVTLIAAVLPAGCVSLHTVFCLRTPLPSMAQHFLCGVFNSLFVNFLVRLRVTTHVTTATVERLPIPTREMAPRAFREIAACARMLARRDDAETFARLNGRVARLYQLSRQELQHVLDTFPLIPIERRRMVMDAFTSEAER